MGDRARTIVLVVNGSWVAPLGARSHGNQHVVSHGERWAVKAEGESEPFALFKTQSEAWEKAKSIARKERSEALLHGRNGVIRTRNTYGHDPNRSKG
jgi:hypothetical protein